jgi:hypothetical protein
VAIRGQVEAVPIQRAEEVEDVRLAGVERAVVELPAAREVATRRSHRSLTLTAKVIGLVVFFVGIYLLWQVFGKTHTLFDALAKPEPGWAKPAADAAQTGPTALDLGMVIGSQIAQVLCLFVLGYVASLISSKGIQLFGAAMENKEAE